MSELLTKMFFGGFVRMHVLYHAVKEPIFGVEMMEELGRHGYDVGAGTLYPMLHQLEEAGYLSVHTEVVAGKQRKYYRATPEGAGRPGRGQGETAGACFRGPSRQAAQTFNPVRPSHGKSAQVQTLIVNEEKCEHDPGSRDVGRVVFRPRDSLERLRANCRPPHRRRRRRRTWPLASRRSRI